MELHADLPEEEKKSQPPGEQNIVLTPVEVQILYKIQHYIDHNLEEKLTIPLLAKQYHIGTTHLKLGFKQYFNSTIYQYILHRRMERAKFLLEAGMRVRQVAAETGYSLTGFSKIFKQYTGVSPLSYRKKK